ncbi:MAG: TonB-dependent receptor, partial [Acidobacteriota bacterium]
FFSFETRQRHEEGFSSIGSDNFGLVPTTVPTIPVPVLLTPDQATFVNNTLGVNPTAAITYAAVVGTWSSIALNRTNPGFLSPLLFGTPTFFDGAPLPGSFTALNALRGNYPVEEDTNFISARIDHRWNNNNSFFIRGSVTPSDVSGIQVNAQNQTFGQNSFSRSSEQSFRDVAVVTQNVSTIGNNWVNEARFQFARRGLSYTPSRDPGRPGLEPLGGEGPGINIGGVAFFGREPFSRVDRFERRYQWTDNVSYLRGNHTFKFGADINFIEIGPRFSNNQVFELNFGAVINFGALGASSLAGVGAAIPDFGAALALGAPGIIAPQSYGFGIPSSFIQGIGDSFSAFDNTAIAFYAQDSWRIRPNFTLNYGVRWEGEATPQLPAFNDVTAQAEAFLGVTEGIRRDWDNVAPRIGLAWDPGNDGKTVIRAAYGLFYDHPLLAIAFNADTADGAQSTQQILFGGVPCSTSLSLNPACLNASSIFQGILNAPASFGFEPNQQRFEPFTANSIFVNQNFCQPDPTFACVGFPLAILPFTLPIEEDFEFGYAQQWNLTVERELVHNLSLSVGYQGVKGAHLNRPRNINVPDPALLVANANPAIAAGLIGVGSDPRTVVVPGADPLTEIPFNPGDCVNTAGGGSIFLSIPAVFGTGFGAPNCAGAPVGAIGTAAAFNFFRATGPNFAFTGGLGIPQAAIIGVATAAGYPLGPGFFVPFSDVLQQESSGASIYHGLTVNLRKRYGNHYQFLASYTWSHAIDDSTDLQTLLSPQDNSRPDLERGNSTFDLRHRFVFSAVFESPFSRNDAGAWRKVFADFVIAPIFEASSGRPFSVLTGADVNLDFGANTDRPSVVPAGTPGAVSSPDLPGVAFLPPTVCPSTTTASTLFFGCTGTLGRNTFRRPMTWNLDLRVSRKIHFDERWNLELIADMFNLFNRFNVGDVNQLCDPIGGRCIAGQPTAALDARQFQFGVKLSW